jgi:hypothetical protein
LPNPGIPSSIFLSIPQASDGVNTYAPTVVFNTRELPYSPSKARVSVTGTIPEEYELA